MWDVKIAFAVTEFAPSFSFTLTMWDVKFSTSYPIAILVFVLP